MNNIFLQHCRWNFPLPACEKRTIQRDQSNPPPFYAWPLV